MHRATLLHVFRTRRDSMVLESGNIRIHRRHATSLFPIHKGSLEGSERGGLINGLVEMVTTALPTILTVGFVPPRKVRRDGGRKREKLKLMVLINPAGGIRHLRMPQYMSLFLVDQITASLLSRAGERFEALNTAYSIAKSKVQDLGLFSATNGHCKAMY
ncbi:hypothetical protein DD237_007598 [Peronospora effusa]|uniref:DAGKc domain-containing protein n=1 Tax=Peronospora effusa TaxID=542832 RepID=A0A3R7XN87_9STRA|nr:hypothetical protein DD237_007598 [Peronospora effusa]